MGSMISNQLPLQKQEGSQVKLKDYPDRPTTDKLPKPRIIWDGETEDATMIRRCRLVLHYQWVMPPNAKEWESQPTCTLEVEGGEDAMGTPIYKKESLERIPVAAFLHLISGKT